MFLDDSEPLKKAEKTFKNLETLSVAALEEYIKELEAEIIRAKEEIKKRGSARDKAQAFFK